MINSFDTATQGGIGTEWGSGSTAWDGDNGNPAGAQLFTVVFSSSSDTPCVDYSCYGQYANAWYVQTPINLSEYKSVQFDIKYDSTSDITVDEFNDLSTWPTTLTNSSGQPVFQTWAGAGYLAGSTPGLEIQLCGPAGQQNSPTIAITNIPEAAASGWVHVVIPINPAQSGIDGISGIVFHKWINQNWGILNDATARFWIDNLMLEGTAAPPGPPTLSAPSRPSPGLNVFASTEGNSFYDRQEAELVQTSGLSWVGHATPENPVTYSFTITNYPKSVNCEAYLFLSPNPGSSEEAPDWNETNCAIAFVQGNATSATMHFQYKVNEPGGNQMYSPNNAAGDPYTNAPGSWDGTTAGYLETGDLGLVTNNGVLGTWTVKFTSDTDGILIAPNGNTSSFTFPAYNTGYFAESSGFRIYLGMQANNADAMNQAVVYSSFAVTGVAAPYSENFLADSVLDTNIWSTSIAHGPKGVLIVPADAAEWVNWSLPDKGFSLQIAGSLNGPWSSPSTATVVPLYGYDSQLVSSSDLPAGSAAFFRLVKRTFTQLQVLLPGETNAPDTETGKTGTPTPVSPGSLVNVTVNAVDANFHIVNVSGDVVSLTTDDGSAITPNDTALANGTMSGIIQFNSTGSWTVTATDTTDTSKTPGTSSSLTVQ
ncbi:MAG TPA: hypothetical protein VHH88_03670 [Verrucomicrobiae bacterium]|nr:hypothetical protein [Verrucomicrobiae bacterium]